eukprot:205852-Prymnesium_polylepis.1
MARECVGAGRGAGYTRRRGAVAKRHGRVAPTRGSEATRARGAYAATRARGAYARRGGSRGT